MSRLPSGFSSIREISSYILGAGALIYGITAAASDKAYFAVGAGLALIGSPIVGSIFEKKG